ncbi:MAG: hypothetical protein AB2421_14800 [Thermotaleaceae bacterium]
MSKHTDENLTLTIFTIPDSFVHIESGEQVKVSPEMYRFVQEHIEQNNIMNVFMTALFRYVHDNRQLVELGRLELKVEEIWRFLQSQKIHMPFPDQFTTTIKSAIEEEDISNHLDELLDEFGG